MTQHARRRALAEAALKLDRMADVYAGYANRERAANAETRGFAHRDRADLYERDCLTLRDAARVVRELGDSHAD